MNQLRTTSNIEDLKMINPRVFCSGIIMPGVTLGYYLDGISHQLTYEWFLVYTSARKDGVKIDDYMKMLFGEGDMTAVRIYRDLKKARVTIDNEIRMLLKLKNFTALRAIIPAIRESRTSPITAKKVQDKVATAVAEITQETGS